MLQVREGAKEEIQEIRILEKSRKIYKSRW
jgi:hypothetical protein